MNKFHVFGSKGSQGTLDAQIVTRTWFLKNIVTQGTLEANFLHERESKGR